MKNEKKQREYHYLFLFTQLGFTIVSPILCCVAAVVLLESQWNIPDLLTVLLILVGVGTGLGGAIRLLFKVDKKDNEKGENDDGSK